MKRKLLFMILAGALLMNAAACTSPAKQSTTDKTTKESEQKEDDADKKDTEQADSDQAEAGQESKPEEQAPAPIAIGEAATLKTWTFTVNAAQIVDEIMQTETYGFQPSAGNKFLRIDMSVTNNGSEADSFLPTVIFGDDLYATVMYQGQEEYQATNLIGFSNDLHSGSVEPQASRDGTIAFEIPEAAAGAEGELILVIKGGTDSVRVKVR